MLEIHDTIKVDLLWFAWIIFAVGLVTYYLIRRHGPLTRWHEHGNVSTAAFSKADLLMVVIVFFILKSLWALITGRFSSVSPEQEASMVNAGVLLTDICIKLTLISFFVLWLIHYRQINPLELFGLLRMKPISIAIWSGVIAVLVTPLVLASGAITAQILTKYIGAPPDQPLVSAFATADLHFKILLIILAVIVTPVFEELFYRGYLYGVVKSYSERFFAALFSAGLFAVLHPGMISLVPIFILGIFLVVAYELTGSLWIPICIHALYNLYNVASMFWFAN